MHTGRGIESELCFRKINTATVHRTETLARMLDICLGINPSEPHAHGFYHHLACKSAWSAYIPSVTPDLFLAP